jgi:hypothetical protein
MSHYFEKNVVEIKREYTEFLISILTPFLYEGFQSMYQNAKTLDLTYEEAAKAKDKNIVEAYLKSAKVREKQAEALKDKNTALAVRYHRVADIYMGPHDSFCSIYKEAVRAENRNNLELVEAYRRSAKARQQQAEALLKGDEELASSYYKLANIYFSAA